MKKLKSSKSLYASGIGPTKVKISGAGPMTKQELLADYNGLLVVLAALVEESNGRVVVGKDTINKIGNQGRTLQLKDGELSLAIQFTNFIERETKDAVNNERSFLDSDAAREAREYLSSIGNDSGRDGSGV